MTNEVSLDQITLFQRPSCPYCVMVFRSLQAMGIELKQEDISRKPAARQELIEKGGKSQVPALKIERDNDKPIWMYESMDIIRFLQNEFGK